MEAIPKSIQRLSSFRQTCRLSAQQEDFVLDILDAIAAGTPLPDGSYRRSRSRDVLLERDGIMHLHIGHAGSRELIYLVQYPDCVVLLEISDHYHFTTRPIGITLRPLHERRIAEWEEE